MKPAVDMTVEFSHVYSDQSFGPTQLSGIQRACRELRKLREQGKTTLSLVLLDDMHVTSRRLSPDQVSAEIARHGGEVDAVVLESDVARGVETLLATLPEGRLELESFRRERKRVLFLQTHEGRVSLGTFRRTSFDATCSLLVAVWHLARLGEIHVAGIPIGKSSLSILEERYRKVEERALRIIEASRFAEAVSRVAHVYI
jgi:hypothetical protein